MKCIAVDCPNEASVSNIKWKNDFCLSHLKSRPDSWHCLMCEKIITSDNIVRRYCDSCKQELNRIRCREYWKNKTRRKRLKLLCKYCFKQIPLDSHLYRYCSKACGYTYHIKKCSMERKLNRKKNITTCPICYKPFFKNANRETFCSKRCKSVERDRRCYGKQRVMIV